ARARGGGARWRGVGIGRAGWIEREGNMASPELWRGTAAGPAARDAGYRQRYANAPIKASASRAAVAPITRPWTAFAISRMRAASAGSSDSRRFLARSVPPC